MSQQFTNNLDSALVLSIDASETFIELPFGIQLSTPSGNQFELLTIEDGGEYEIVRMTQRWDALLEVVRGQEGTTARAWPAGARVFGGVTAGTLRRMVQSMPADAVAVGGNAINIQSARTADARIASGASATAIGQDTQASGAASTAVGLSAEATGDTASALGGGAKAFANNSLAAGNWSTASAPSSVALAGGYVPGAADASAAMGDVASAVEHTLALGFLPAVPNTEWGWGTEDAWWAMQAPGTMICTAPVSLTATGVQTITLPDGLRFFVDEVGLIVTEADAVTGQPTVRFGVTGDNGALLAAVETTGLTADGHRQRFTSLLSAAGVTSLVFEVTAAGAATALSARAYFRGTAVVNDGVDGEA